MSVTFLNDNLDLTMKHSKKQLFPIKVSLDSVNKSAIKIKVNYIISCVEAVTLKVLSSNYG